MTDSKYLTFKRNEMEQWITNHLFINSLDELPTPVLDAVVIRRQDSFAPPALDAYSNAIMCAVEALREAAPFDERWEGLADIADYFREQAEEAWHTHRKLPD